MMSFRHHMTERLLSEVLLQWAPVVVVHNLFAEASTAHVWKSLCFLWTEKNPLTFFYEVSGTFFFFLAGIHHQRGLEEQSGSALLTETTERRRSSAGFRTRSIVQQYQIHTFSVRIYFLKIIQVNIRVIISMCTKYFGNLLDPQRYFYS